MSNIISLNSKRYLPHELKTRENAVITYRKIVEIAVMYVENIIFLGRLYGDGIRNMMAHWKV